MRVLRSGSVLAQVLVAGVLCARGQGLPDAPAPVKPGMQTATPQATPQAAVPEPVAGDAIYAPVAVGRDTTRIKLEDYLVLTFGPRAIVSPAVTAAIRMARPPAYFPKDWKNGADAFGRNYGEALVSKVALQTARTGVSILLHEDVRYRRSPTAKGFGRLFHAIGYTFVDSSDSGHRTLAVANFAGAAASGFTSIAILPDGYNSVGDGAKDAATRFGGLAFSNVAREYAPEILKVVRALHVPFPRLPVPVWYTKKLTVARPISVPPAPAADAAPKPVDPALVKTPPPPQ